MSLCVAIGAAVLSFAVPEFTLSWTHSVEQITWWERWEVTEAGIRPIEALIKGSGAGMEPPETAQRTEDGWYYRPELPLQKEVLLAASGATGGGWTLCAAAECRVLGADPGEGLRLWSAPQCDQQP